jgi:lipopolysaccharide transport system permease protein
MCPRVSATASHSLSATTVIVPKRPVWRQVAKVWQYRELLYFFAWREVKVRYKQTVIGAAWAILQPTLLMIVFTLFFGRLARVPSEGLPYPVFYYAALVPWTYFSTSVTNATNSLVLNQTMITRVYFPRLLLPVSHAVAGLIDLALAFVLLVGLVLFYGFRPTLSLAFLPLFVVLAFLSAVAAGVWLSAFNAIYRDVRHALPFIIQFWLFATPIAYPSALVPARWRALYGLNPMAGVAEGFRWSVTGHGRPPGTIVGMSAIAVVFFLLTGLAYFQRSESTIVDKV